jgi:DNA polymerase-3 subunit delta'
MALSDIIGHSNPVRILIGTIKKGRIPSAMLFSGDSGIGKMLTALNYAKALNCLSPVGFDACDKCASCLKIENSAHPDVSVIVPENDEIKIEAIREAEELLSLRPYEGDRKVLILDNAERMNISASNAFLKTLEEPPGDSLIILISPNPDRLTDTVRSRCMHLRFRPLPEEAFRKLLSLSPESKTMAAFSGLTMGRPGIGHTTDFAADRKWFLDILNAMYRGETRCVWADKADIKKWLDLCFIWLRDNAVFSITRSDADLLYGDKRPCGNIAALLEASQKLQKVRGLIDLNLNKAITWNFVSGIIQSVVLDRETGRHTAIA